MIIVSENVAAEPCNIRPLGRYMFEEVARVVVITIFLANRPAGELLFPRRLGYDSTSWNRRKLC